MLQPKPLMASGPQNASTEALDGLWAPKCFNRPLEMSAVARVANVKVFVAGATGTIGRPLVRQLVEAGHEVVGMTSTEANLPQLQALGAEAVVCDALDATAVKEAVARAEAEVAISQLTKLPKRGY